MKRVLFCLLLITAIVVNAQGQDAKKVIAVVHQMEADLKAMIEKEKAERQAAYKEMLAEIQALKNPAHGAPAKAVEEKEAKPNAKELIDRLREGNKRFVDGKLAAKDFAAQRVELAKGQKPFVMVLTCSDSRVPPEFIFDESLGQVFVIRVAGNVVDSVALGSIEYAAEHLHASLLLVLGHESCGAVKATIAGGEVPPNIGSLVRRIKPAVDRTKAKQLKETDVLSACIEENVSEQMEKTIQQSGVLREMVEKGELSIAGAIYNLASGSVRFLDQKVVSEVLHAPKEKTVPKTASHSK